jgi:hypothetical protein
MELWDNGKRVTTRMPCGEGGHEGGEDTGSKRTTPQPSERKHGSYSVHRNALFDVVNILHHYRESTALHQVHS